MDQRRVRIDAVRRHLRGETITSICRGLGRSRRWFYYWYRRYSPTQSTWAESRSRAPHHQARRVSKNVEHLVCEVRKHLLEHKYSQRGAVAIQWELRLLGVHPVPAVWTINRIIQRHRLRARRPRARPQPKYPKREVSRPGIAQQLDLVGPRYLSGGSRFYSLHLIDAHSNAVALETIPSKHTEVICQALLGQWRRLGVPHYLQVDNELSFRGSNKYPRSLGLLVRLCFHVGTELVFIPEGEPWRNGIVERFNDTYDKCFFRRQRFSSLGVLQRELRIFEQFHNEHHRYAKLRQRTPQTVHHGFRRTSPSPRLDLAEVRRSWKDGRVSFVRLTDDQGTVRFFTEHFLVDPALVHEYITGTITTRDDRLRFYHDNRCIKTVKYSVSKNPLV